MEVSGVFAISHYDAWFCACSLVLRTFKPGFKLEAQKQPEVQGKHYVDEGFAGLNSMLSLKAIACICSFTQVLYNYYLSCEMML